MTDEGRDALLKKRDGYIIEVRDAYQTAKRALDDAQTKMNRARDAEREYVRESFLSLGIELGKTRVKSRKTGTIGVIDWNTHFVSIEKNPGAALGESSAMHIREFYYVDVAFYPLKKNGEPRSEPAKAGSMKNNEYLDCFRSDSIWDFAGHFEIIDVNKKREK